MNHILERRRIALLDLLNLTDSQIDLIMRVKDSGSTEDAASVLCYIARGLAMDVAISIVAQL